MRTTVFCETPSGSAFAFTSKPCKSCLESQKLLALLALAASVSPKKQWSSRVTRVQQMSSEKFAPSSKVPRGHWRTKHKDLWLNLKCKKKNKIQHSCNVGCTSWFSPTFSSFRLTLLATLWGGEPNPLPCLLLSFTTVLLGSFLPYSTQKSCTTLQVVLFIVQCPFREEHLVVCWKIFLYIWHLGQDVPSHPPPVEGYWWPISATAKGTDLI